MKQIKKDLIIASILLMVIIISYPLLIGGAYSLADQDDRVIPTIEGIKPVIDGLYVLAFVLACFTISSILWCWYFGEGKKSDETKGLIKYPFFILNSKLFK